uniref:Uncharacterized protein n=1 Tax=Anguilla anguilla TaxID=7936 RepID=A0A0E9XM12_ANGAN
MKILTATTMSKLLKKYNSNTYSKYNHVERHITEISLISHA